MEQAVSSAASKVSSTTSSENQSVSTSSFPQQQQQQQRQQRAPRAMSPRRSIESLLVREDARLSGLPQRSDGAIAFEQTPHGYLQQQQQQPPDVHREQQQQQLVDQAVRALRYHTPVDAAAMAVAVDMPGQLHLNGPTNGPANGHGTTGALPVRLPHPATTGWHGPDVAGSRLARPASPRSHLVAATGTVTDAAHRRSVAPRTPVPVLGADSDGSFSRRTPAPQGATPAPPTRQQQAPTVRSLAIEFIDHASLTPSLPLQQRYLQGQQSLHASGHGGGGSPPAAVNSGVGGPWTTTIAQRPPVSGWTVGLSATPVGVVRSPATAAPTSAPVPRRRVEAAGAGAERSTAHHQAYPMGDADLGGLPVSWSTVQQQDHGDRRAPRAATVTGATSAMRQGVAAGGWLLSGGAPVGAQMGDDERLLAELDDLLGDDDGSVTGNGGIEAMHFRRGGL